MRSRKNILRSRRPRKKRLACCPAVVSHLTIVDKARVIAVGLIRRKIAKNPTDLIRRKFSIDADRDATGGVFHIHQFETIRRGQRKPAIHHLRARDGQTAGEIAVFCHPAHRLSVRLMSL